MSRPTVFPIGSPPDDAPESVQLAFLEAARLWHMELRAEREWLDVSRSTFCRVQTVKNAYKTLTDAEDRCAIAVARLIDCAHTVGYALNPDTMKATV